MSAYAWSQSGSKVLCMSSALLQASKRHSRVAVCPFTAILPCSGGTEVSLVAGPGGGGELLSSDMLLVPDEEECRSLCRDEVLLWNS